MRFLPRVTSLFTVAVRARRWAPRATPGGAPPRLILRLAPLALVTVLGALTCCVLGAVALGRRLWRFRRAGQA